MRTPLLRGAVLGLCGTLATTAVARATLGPGPGEMVLFSLPTAMLLCAALAWLAAQPGARLWKLALLGVLAALVNGPLTGIGLTFWALAQTGENRELFSLTVAGTAMLAPALAVVGLAVGGAVWALEGHRSTQPG